MAGTPQAPVQQLQAPVQQLQALVFRSLVLKAVVQCRDREIQLAAARCLTAICSHLPMKKWFAVPKVRVRGAASVVATAAAAVASAPATSTASSSAGSTSSKDLSPDSISIASENRVVGIAVAGAGVVGTRSKIVGSGRSAGVQRPSAVLMVEKVGNVTAVAMIYYSLVENVTCCS